MDNIIDYWLPGVKDRGEGEKMEGKSLFKG